MIKGAIFDMDGTLVDNTPVHIRAFEIFCERYGIRDWKEKLGQAYGMGNDDIMRLIMPAEVIRERGSRHSPKRRNPSTGRSTPRDRADARAHRPLAKAPRRRHTLRRRFVGLQAQCGFRAGKMPYRALFRRQDQRRHGLALQTRPGDLPYGRRGLGLPAAECVVFEDAPAGIEAARRAGAEHIVALATTLDRAALAQTDADRVIDDFRDITDLDALLK